jgi:hypothetical protein
VGAASVALLLVLSVIAAAVRVLATPQGSGVFRECPVSA